MNTDNSEILNKKHTEDFNRVLDIYENTYSHEALINLLKSGSVAEKQAAALKLDELHNSDDADILMSNLTDCDGKIREAVSFRLAEFIRQNPEYFTKHSDIFIKAIIDINGNICRNTISALKNLKNYPQFCENFCKKLEENAYNLSLQAKNFDIQEGKYKINKEIFKLYWYLEAIYEFSEYINENPLEQILLNAKEVDDYTIREKAAKIISKQKNVKFSYLKEELKNDKNYYVRRF